MDLPTFTAFGVFGIGILTFCLGIYRITNGRMLDITDRLNGMVNQKECHFAQDKLIKHIDDKHKDLKDFISNGK